MENSVFKISWKLVENWLRNQRNSLILVDEFCDLTIVRERSTDAELMLGQRRTQWTNLGSTSNVYCVNPFVENII